MIEVQGIWYEAVPLTIINPETDPVLNNLIPTPKRVVEAQNVVSSRTKPNVVETDSQPVISTEAERSGGFLDVVPRCARNDSGTVVDIFVPENDIMEFLPVGNERGIIVGRALQMELHKGNKILHPVVHLHVINNRGEVVRRYWWHVAFGDAPEKTLKRKMQETLGLTAVKPKLKKQYIRETKTEKELVYVYFINSDENLLKTPEGKEYFDIFAKD